MDSEPTVIFDHEQIVRTVNILRRQGITSRADLRARFDKHADFEAVMDIGPKRAAILRSLLELPDTEWVAFTGLEA